MTMIDLSNQQEILSWSDNRLVQVYYEGRELPSRRDYLHKQNFFSRLSPHNNPLSYHVTPARWVGFPKGTAPYMKRNIAMLDLVIDFDCKTMRQNVSGMQYVKKLFTDHGLDHYWIIKTGGKGFHVWVSFESFFESAFIKRNTIAKAIVLYHAIYDYLKTLGYEVDDKANLTTVRAPFCSNEKSNGQSRVIHGSRGFQPVYGEAKDLGEWILGKMNITEQQFIERTEIEMMKMKPRKKRVPQKRIDFEKIPPCMSPNRVINGNRESAAFAVVSFLHGMGWKQKETTSYMSGWFDHIDQDGFSVDEINNLIEQKYESNEVICPGCDWLNRRGICPVFHCIEGNPISPLQVATNGGKRG